MSQTKLPGRRRSVLISGASIAGPALAFWLERYGFAVTVVERAATVRTGGYPIDVRGTAVDVIEEMGLLPQVRAAHVHSRAMTFVDGKGGVIGSVPTYEMIGSDMERDVELPRGTLTMLLYEATKNGAIEYRFNDRIETLHDDGAGVDVHFASGRQERYDLVVGADGLHSRTRRLVFGPEEQFIHSLGFCFGIFSLPNDYGLSHEGVFHAEPGRTAGLFAVQDSDRVFGFLTFAAGDSSTSVGRDAEAQIRRTRAVFAGMGWEVPRLLDAMAAADDLYFDSVSQIRMPGWSKGRVVLVGDAAFAPSFRSGQGTSLALVGAYVLAGELATHDDPVEAFAAYERVARPFVEANQALVNDGNGGFFLPETQADLDARDRALAEMTKNRGAVRPVSARQPVHSAISLPDYSEGEMPG
ncbi:FAD-dependent monooxygenase [Acetobacter oeni]|uniref:Oxidoreductase n=1 Tax=Acetobacter oeni TaxID=304077 RepID=A0A511XKF4_9PROT|nr:FAD-dependent monooxygenase [Acetobacter oeni]MBB3881386.1 2-polyprenyl-6-methoxyphenol hydroxylase-like FAD-dependent oxidoreductase [Acetobacter oeni]NHO18254.1 FAD-dependent oxidoreductase [Acetobacter oeni]GBR11157.1 2-polyprenyl-6-methoxyphenol hydroxylase [Acetobacter oeni LMG 21952]GEN63421.1 oxidoreductase [Acetobacter oeni]